VNGDGEEDKNYYRIQTDRRGWGCGQYSGDAVGMGTKYFTVSSSTVWYLSWIWLARMPAVWRSCCTV